jgi:hypothetical protein
MWMASSVELVPGIRLVAPRSRGTAAERDRPELEEEPRNLAECAPVSSPCYLARHMAIDLIATILTTKLSILVKEGFWPMARNARTDCILPGTRRPLLQFPRGPAVERPACGYDKP